MEESLLEDKSVLVVEDNAINQFLVRHSLEKLGAVVEIIDNGVDAVDRIQSKKFDLVLMDIQLPEMDGYETTLCIRNQLKSNVPIVAMTAYALQGEDEKCLQVGMNGYLSKPFTTESLYDAIKGVLLTETKTYDNPYIISNKSIALDLSLLYEISSDDTSYVQAMISTFIENMPATIAKMEESLNSGDYNQLYKSAHYAKSSLSVIKISDMLSIAEKIEQYARTGQNTALIPSLFEQFKLKYNLAEQLLLLKFSSVV